MEDTAAYRKAETVRDYVVDLLTPLLMFNTEVPIWFESQGTVDIKYILLPKSLADIMRDLNNVP